MRYSNISTKSWNGIGIDWIAYFIAFFLVLSLFVYEDKKGRQPGRKINRLPSGKVTKVSLTLIPTNKSNNKVTN